MKRLLSVASCAAFLVSGVVSPSTASAGSVPTYTGADSGSSVSAASGTIVRIVLRTHSDGGYTWAVTRGRHSPHFTIVSRREVAAQQQPGMVGGDSRTIFRIRATAAGVGRFAAVERRSFDHSDVVRRFRLRIKVS